MGASMLCGVTGISPAVFNNSAAYLANWIQVLKGDSKLLVQAASAAQKAADCIRGISQKSVGEVSEAVRSSRSLISQRYGAKDGTQC